MSRAFVNEERFEQAGGEELVDRPISEFANYVTPTGALALHRELLLGHLGQPSN